MKVQRTGPTSVIFTVDANELPMAGFLQVDAKHSDWLREKAREILEKQGITQEGRLELEAFAMGGNAIVFVSCVPSGDAPVCYRFARPEDMIDAAREAVRLQRGDGSRLLCYEGRYYIELANQDPAAPLLSEYATTLEGEENQRILQKGRPVIAS